MSRTLYVRLSLALASVLGPFWLTTHMPAGSAFATEVATPFAPWHALVGTTSLLLALLLARMFARL